MRAASRTAGSLVSGLVIGVLVVGCGGEDPSPSPGPSPATSGPTQTPDDPSSEPTPAEPAVTPATGLLLEEETSQVNAPAGDWERLPDIVDYASAAGHLPTAQVISLSDRESYASPASLDEQVKYHNRTLPEGAVIQRQPDVLLDGAPAYYVQWYEKGDARIQHDIGLDHGGRVISIQMDLDRADRAAAEALVASVLASFVWR
ncbi:MAG TPA: hypothetical protein VFI44_06380 [Ornithinibacter sp.]|nr:hypothetical protein [Ornithinibacter sp.]